MSNDDYQNKLKELRDESNYIQYKINKLADEYIQSLPFKVGDKIKSPDKRVAWIAEIRNFSGNISVYVNYAKKDGTRSNRLEYFIHLSQHTIKHIVDNIITK